MKKKFFVEVMRPDDTPERMTEPESIDRIPSFRISSPGMSQNKLLIPLIVLFAAGLVIWTIFSADSQTGSLVSKTHNIVYKCNDDDGVVDTSAICIINSNGTGQRTLVTGVDLPPFSNPGMNDLGQIVYDCDHTKLKGESPLYRDICLINADGTSNLRINPYSSVASDMPVKISNLGQIVFDCGGICFTTINRALVSDSPVQRIWFPNLRRHGLFPVGFNNDGRGVFSCFDVRENHDYGYDYNLCTFDLENRSVQVLLHGSATSGYLSGAINDSGLIVYYCGDATNGGNICSSEFDGSNERQLNRTRVPSLSIIWDMNNRGDIVFECSTRGLPLQICVMNVNDTDYRQITSGQTDDTSPSISEDGVIAYACGKHLCVINFDGTGQRKLTTEESDLGVGLPVIR